MSPRAEFVVLASVDGANVSEWRRRFGVSRKTGYKWLSRYATDGVAGLVDQSRRPLESARRTSAELEQQILTLRREHPAWGSRKRRRRLQDLKHVAVPVASTITEIPRRHGQLDERAGAGKPNLQRFEHAAPDVQVRRASLQGVIQFDSCSIHIGRAFCREPIGVRATATSGLHEVFYAHQSLGQFDMSQTPRGSREILNIHRVRRE